MDLSLHSNLCSLFTGHYFRKLLVCVFPKVTLSSSFLLCQGTAAFGSTDRGGLGTALDDGQTKPCSSESPSTSITEAKLFLVKSKKKIHFNYASTFRLSLKIDFFVCYLHTGIIFLLWAKVKEKKKNRIAHDIWPKEKSSHACSRV